MAITLIIFALVSQDATTVDLLVERQDLQRAPRIAPLPEGLPDLRRAPVDGYWKDGEHDKYRAGTFLPEPLDQELLRRARLLDYYPTGVCQPRLDGLGELRILELEKQAAALEAQCVAVSLDRAVSKRELLEDAVPFWQAALAVGVTVLVAGGLGFGLRALTFR